MDVFTHRFAFLFQLIFGSTYSRSKRCMITRRDNPDGSLWRLVVEGFSLLDDIRKLTGNAGPKFTITRPAIMRIWKEVADIFEIFLIGYCGRALSVMVDSADESPTYSRRRDSQITD
ncbi:hypothetical protein H5410_033850 [Solanum commersonii]|uniref:Uncharacterized protein n=1 Tax=Solanum commersonii TaxID=4109 RepID=A0A9J5YRY5_SOLCO|nr:hypothetical protein H5410_033850 [Solanum commersonii]